MKQIREQETLQLHNTQRKYPHNQCIHLLFESQVEQTPNAVAVVFNEQQLTYRELNAKANQLANYLQKLGVGAEVLVGLCLERSLDMVIAMLGILKAGGAYVPLDPAYPQERLAYMVQDAQLSIVITQKSIATEQFSTSPQNLNLVCLEEDWESIKQQDKVNLNLAINSDNLAYIIYTSGSTGKPKGVQINHGSVVNLLQAIAICPGLSNRDTMLAVTTICFDVSVPEIYTPLTVGGKVVVASSKATKDPDKLIELITKQKITIMSATPATWRMLLDAHWEGSKQLKIISTGESLSRDLGEKLLTKCASLWNLYGPTEITVWATFYQVKSGENSIPIGKPIANTQAYILNANGEKVTTGESGELHIGGLGLARGYLHQPELTEAKFIPNPFSQEPDSLLYKTGDLARYLPDGNIECLGRIDNQVKVKGYRIELGEIETTLRQHSQVKQAVVTAREEKNNQKRLVGYIVPDTSSEPSETQDTAKETEKWEKIWDEAYIQPDEAQDGSFHIGGWNDSYTGKDLEPEQVREWVEDTVERILDLQPQRLLEIGCGTGMLLFRIAPQCQHYYATDLSGEAIRYLEKQLDNSELKSCVALRQTPADGLGEIVTESFDTAISNSVIQFFPGINYLVEVIETAVNLVEPGGQIFLGDILSLPLLETFHTSVQLYQAPATLPVSQLKQRISDRLSREQRLIIDPQFFIALKDHLPQISHVEIQLKRGQYQNELTRFRYDVVLHLGKKVSIPKTPPVFLNWKQDILNIATVCQQLTETSPEILIVKQVPNRRIWADVKATELLANLDCPETVEEIRQQITTEGIEPEEWWDCQGKIPYRINITWSGNGDGYYDVIFVREDSKIIADNTITDTQQKQLQPWSAYANQTYSNSQSSQLIPQLRNFLTEKLPDYMVPSAFVILDQLPLTPSGKIDRRALPAPDKSRPIMDVELVAPRTPTEEILVSIWTEILNLNEIGVLDNFFMLGGDSIQATQLISRVRDTFGIELSLHRLFEFPTVEEFSRDILGASRQNLASIQPIPRAGELPLSFAEQRLWFLDQLQQGNTTYNEQEGLRLQGSLQVEILHQALQEIVRRHESLRTNFQAINGSPVRVILPELDLPMPIVNLQHLPSAEKLPEVQRWGEKEIQKPFDLAQDSLLRVTLLQLDTDDYVLLMTMHHIITDGWSTGVLSHELEVLYGAFVEGKPLPLPPLPIQYADFAAWQRQPDTAQMLAPQLNYWQQQLAGAPQLLELSTDYPRKTIQTAQGGKEFFELGRDFTQQLKGLSQDLGVTLFMTLFASFSTLLYRYSGQEDLVIGTPIANRNRSEIEGLIGFFVNTLVLRTQFENNPSFTELLHQVRQTALDAYAHQDVPFEQLVEVLQPERSLSYTPIFQVAFALQNAPMAPLELPGVSFNWLQIESAKAKFDLTLSMEETEAGLIGYWEYNRELFEPATIRRAIGHFKTLLEGIVANPQMGVSELPLLTEDERYQLLVEFNNTETNYLQNKCIHQLFEEQVEQTPDAVAVVFEDEKLTYQELNERANQLARYLQNLGVKEEVLVGIFVERSVEMVIGLLGIIKAEGAYVPIAPDYPQERIDFILEDAQLSIVLTQQQFVEKLPKTQAQIVTLDADTEAISSESQQNLVNQIKPNNLAYVVYTSGSTGKPKGVTVTHVGINRLVNNTNYINLQPSDRIAQISNIAFDAATFEIWGALLHGAKLIVIPQEIALSAQKFATKLQEEKISVVLLTTALFNQFATLIPEAFKSLRYLLFGGEAVEPTSVKKVLEQGAPETLLHAYGPTENTVISSSYLVEDVPEGAKTIPIGRPIANTQIYILDQHLQPVPIGIPGEIHLGGAGLAKGYLNRPELTKQKFIPNPFSNKSDSPFDKTEESNNTFVPYPHNKCIHQLFEEQVEKTPDAIAVVFEEEQLTYQELNERANQLARYLQNLGVKEEVLVGICVERSVEMIIGILGILKAGGAYVPFDSNSPTERLNFILTDAQISILITQENIQTQLPSCADIVICLDTDWDKIAQSNSSNLNNSFKPETLAYVIYTSGSTGKPKGVLIEHNNVTRLFAETQPWFSFNSNDVWTLFHSYAFDFSVWELWGALLHGGCLVVVPYWISRSPQDFYQLLCQHQVTVLNQTPSAFRQLIQVEELLETEQPLNLRLVIFGGEALEINSLEPWFNRHGDNSPQLINMYGITETTVHVTYRPLLKSDLNSNSSPIGLPIPDLQVYILDAQEQPVPIGIPGELHISGAGLARGYLNRPELTHTKFIPNPFSNQTDSRLYKTGDLARYLPDGNVEFIGRIDNQVKIRGFRIEIGEIEAILAQYQDIREVVVIAREDSPGDKRLVAYLVTQEEVELAQLRSFLKTKLPDYMVPSAFVFLETIPLTSNGKVNRRALPAPNTDTQPAETIAPRNTTELQLSQIWSEVLNIPTVGVGDNFFDLGGHSLLAVRLMARIEQELGINLPLQTLFTEPTIESQANLLSSQGKTNSYSPLVTIQKKGNLPPFFCVHPVGGNVLCYAELARHLGKNQPFYGLQSAGLFGERKPLTTIEEMAANYIQSLQEIQPKGPYYLGGWSMGGVVAWEMAQQLQKAEQEVALVALIDSYAPSTMSELSSTDEASLANSLAADLAGLFGTELPITSEEFQKMQPQEQLKRILAEAKRLNILPLEVGMEQMQNLFQVFQANRLALANYKPQPYSGKVALFCADSSTEDRGWNSLITGELETYTIPGNHYGMMRSPGVADIAQNLSTFVFKAKY